ncbi:hypothetical protein GCM10023149_37250 [Mucilaginibacter gynuensis]|uniref:Pectate lyase superfamily protein domain-containing protein n=1 Tax=Mucilaginibacter gynuensis TaxID=1302236 RepID=A0ABP8GXQ9_9SPHI
MNLLLSAIINFLILTPHNGNNQLLNKSSHFDQHANVNSKTISLKHLRSLKTAVKGLRYHTLEFGEGDWYYDPNDHTSKDNTGTIIVSSNGSRYKRILNDSTINIEWFGADKTGLIDCSDLIRKAQSLGNVYFPKGSYLVSTVDLVSNRKYFGDGINKTYIKSNYQKKKIKSTFAISTYDYDQSGHSVRNIENLEIFNLTFDFNFNGGWIDFFAPIQLKGKPGNFIRNIKLYNLSFMDSAKVIHPDLTGGKGKDAWCINLSSFADSTTDISIENCISNAESHQFVAGGGSVLKRVKVKGNNILRPKANGIAFTTVSENKVDFEDFEVSNNTIIDADGSSILFGHDPSPVQRSVNKQTFSNFRIIDNIITIGNYRVYGKNYRKENSFPYVINISGGEPYLKDVIVKNNKIDIAQDYNGNDIFLGRLQAFKYNRKPVLISSEFVQPVLNKAVTISINNVENKNKVIFQPDAYIAISTGGIYKILKVNKDNIEIQLQNIGTYTEPGETIKANNKLFFLGGILKNISFIDNKITGKIQVKFTEDGILDGLNFSGNNKTTIIMKYESGFIINALVENNSQLSVVKTAGFFKGKIGTNIFINNKNLIKGLQIKPTISRLTGFADQTQITQ